QTTLTPTMTIDGIASSLHLRPSLLKLDVEGWEPQALRGARKLLSGDNSPAICLEWNPLTMSETDAVPAEMIAALGQYDFYYVNDFQGQRKPFGQKVENLESLDWACNIFAVPR